MSKSYKKQTLLWPDHQVINAVNKEEYFQKLKLTRKELELFEHEKYPGDTKRRYVEAQKNIREATERDFDALFEPKDV